MYIKLFDLLSVDGTGESTATVNAGRVSSTATTGL